MFAFFPESKKTNKKKVQMKTHLAAISSPALVLVIKQATITDKAGITKF